MNHEIPKHKIHILVATPETATIHYQEKINLHDTFSYDGIRLKITNILVYQQSRVHTHTPHKFYEINFKQIK